MGTEWNVISVASRADAFGTPWWEFVCEVPPDVVSTGFLPCLFPESSIATYAGQFGFPVEDRASILDVIMHEHMLRPRQAAGEMPMVFPARMEEQAAREMLVGLVDRVKRENLGGIVQRPSVFRGQGKGNLLTRIIDAVVIDREVVADVQYATDMLRRDHGVRAERGVYANGMSRQQFAESRRLKGQR